MSGSFVHKSEDIFANAKTFNLDRWLRYSQSLDNWLVAFSRGARSCLGIKYEPPNIAIYYSSTNRLQFGVV